MCKYVRVQRFCHLLNSGFLFVFSSLFQFAPSILEEFLPFLDYMIRDQYIP